MNLASAVVVVAVLALAGLAVRRNLRRKGGCACGCEGCKGSCHCGK